MNRVLLALACVAVSACATQEAVPPTAFRLASPELPDNGMMQARHAGNLKAVPSCADGGNLTPALSWSNVPEKARSLALLIDDQAGRAGLGVVHLVAYGIPPSVRTFAEGELSRPPSGNRFVLGKNSTGATAYLGPCPPRGNAPQHYVFTLIATDLEPSALAPGLTKDEVLKALQGGRTLRAASLVLRYAH